jgi:hypothetical protein
MDGSGMRSAIWIVNVGVVSSRQLFAFAVGPRRPTKFRRFGHPLHSAAITQHSLINCLSSDHLHKTTWYEHACVSS